GVDGSASNDTSDMLGEVRNAMLLQRVKYGANALTARKAFELCINGGARMLGYNSIGKIKEGWIADLAVFDLNRLEYTGSLSDPLAALVFTGISHQTKYTIVNGKVVVENGKLVGIDENQIIENGNRIAIKLLNAKK
ncbi:MAG: amidohydrolase family protein, partial [Ignavibacteria bacterium]|nr:amidohydrolase family protein [Ignavibacteria bacterium]